MAKHTSETNAEPSSPLRQRAEELWRSRRTDIAGMPAEDIQALVHELEVHQIELELQIEELQDSEQQATLLAAAVSHLGEGMLITNDKLDWPGPHIVFVNEGMCRITGYAANELIGQSPRILQGHDTDRETLDRIKTELSAGRSCLAELINYRKDGTPYNAELYVTPLADAEGRRKNFVSIHRDVTDRKRTEQALKNSEERMRAILNTAVDAIITINQRGMVTGVNPATERMFGYAEEEMLGKNVSMLMPQPYRDEHDRYVARYLETGEPRIIGVGREVIGKRKNGSTFPIDLAVSQIDHLGLFTGIIRDITQRKEAQESARRVHELAEKMISTAPNIVLVLDTEGRIVRFNPYMEELTGWQLDEVKDKDWFETFLREDDAKRIRAVFSKAIGGEPTRGNIIAILTRDGRERDIEWYDAPLTNDEGQLIGLLCTGQDITERRILERELLDIADEERRRLGHDLHDGVGQELTGLGMAAHALAEMLSGADGGKSTAHLPANLSEVAKRISDGIGRTTAHVRQLSHGLVPVDVDAQGLMSALKELVASIDGVDDISCTFECDRPVEVADNFSATHLYRIAQEAINNALRHSRAKHVRVGLTDRDGPIILSITDDGIGIPDVSQHGSGMGLRIMRYRADLIGADLSIEPARDAGTRIACSAGAREMRHENAK